MPITESTFHVQPETAAEWNAVVAIMKSYGYHWNSKEDPGPTRSLFNGEGTFRHITVWGKSSGGGFAGRLTHGEYAQPPRGEKTPGGVTDTPGRGTYALISASSFLTNHRIILSHYSLPQPTRRRVDFRPMIETQVSKWR